MSQIDMSNNERAHPDEAVPDGPKGLRRRGKGPSYYFKRQYRNERHTIALGHSPEQAKRKAQEIINAMDRGDFSLSDFQVRQYNILASLTDAMHRLGTRAAHGYKSKASYENRIRLFISFLAEEHAGVSNLGDLPPDVGYRYVEWRRSQRVTRCGGSTPSTPRKPPAPVTIQDDVRRLRALFQLVVIEKEIHSNPFADVRVPTNANQRSTPQRWLSEREAAQLIAAAKRYDSAKGKHTRSTFKGMMCDIIQFYLLTGLRKEELIHLPWSNVHLDWAEYGRFEIGPINEAVILRIAIKNQSADFIREIIASKKKRDLLFKNTKQMSKCIQANYANQEESNLMKIKVSAWDDEAGILSVPTHIQWRQKATQGSVPLVPQTRQILIRRKQANTHDSPFVFPHSDSGPLRSDPLPEFKKLLIDAKLATHTRLHDLRHTFGFTLRKNGVPLETIMGLMRHADIKETMLYAKYSDDEGARHIQCLNGFAKK